MNHCVPDFEMDDDDYSILPSPDLKRPKKSPFGNEETMELMWQNGQVVALSQNQKPLKESHNGEAAISSDQSPGRETRSEEEKRTQLFLQDDEMASWLYYPLEHSSFDRDFCADLLYPTPCAPVTATPTHAVACVSHASLAEVLPPTQSAAPAPRPHMPPTRRLAMESPAKKHRDFELFSRITSEPSSSTKAGRESMVVESHESPVAETGSGVSRGADVATTVSGGKLGCGTMSRTAAADASFAHCELTVTSSSPVRSGASTSVSVEPYKERTPEPTEDRQRKGRDNDNANREDVGLEPADAKKPLMRRSRVAEVHNLSERRRRDRINEKMKALQELIPNCNNLDKASMLDEAIEYLKSLQMQLKMMPMGCTVVPVIFPGFQHYMPIMVPFQNPAFHIPAVHGPGPSRIQATNQSDEALNSLVSQNLNHAQIPSFANPYQQFLGHRQGSVPLPKNKAMVHQSTSKPSGSKEAGSPDNHQSGSPGRSRR